MKNIKKISNLGLALTLIAGSVSYAAPGNRAQGATAVIAGGYPIIRPPGTFTEIDIKSKTFTDLFDRLDAADVQYVENMIQRFNEARKELFDVLAPKVRALEIDGNGSTKGVDAKKYMTLAAEYKTKIASIESYLGLVMLTPSARVQNAKADLHTEHMTVSFQGRLKSVDFSTIKVEMQTKIDALKADLESIDIQVYSKQAGGRVIQKFGAALIEELKRSFSADEINEMRDAAEKLETNAQLVYREKIKASNAGNIRILESFQKIYGIDETYRIQMDDEGFKSATKALEDLYMARTLQRYSTGAPIGSFGVPDTRKKFHLNILPKKGDNELVIDKTTYFDPEQLRAKHRHIVEVLNTQTDRSKNPLGESIGFIARIASLVNILRGQISASVCNTFVLGLMLNDIDEELLMHDAGGLSVLKTRISERLIGAKLDPATKEKNIAWIKSIKAVLESANGKVAQDKTSAIGSASTTGTLGTVKEIQKAATIYMTSLMQAANQRVQADVLEAGGNALRSNSDSRLDDLLGDEKKR